jgi:hypothetical protein
MLFWLFEMQGFARGSLVYMALRTSLGIIAKGLAGG